MSYRTVGQAPDITCEVCGAVVRGQAIRGGCVVERCERCGHLERDLERCPADHRDLAYGGEPTLDRIRLGLTYRELVRDGVPGRVFEVGYGSGSMLRRFLDDGARVGGVDPDQLGIGVDEVVRERGDLRVGGIEDTSGLPGDQDLVYGIHVLEHVVDPHAALRSSLELLRPGGTASFLTPAGDSSGVERYGAAWWMLEDPTHVRFFTADSLARAAEAAGFVDVEVRRLLLDSLSVDAASVARAVRPGPRPRGVLASRAVLAGAVASIPVVLAERALRPRSRPTLQLLARRP
ncbi:class I SAM-dependent methyltransferase [Janibacter anophelis]|uniref:class I SAM-dependent methyltransferase n=1 Tax=Janibacter anophelis TaxID=319054 RepID=UPI003F800CD7